MRSVRAASFIATVGGVGYAPFAPGTWGSVAGVGLAIMVLRWLDHRLYLGLASVSFVIGSLVCTAAERQIGRHDPSEIVLDETWAMAAILLWFQPASVSWVWTLLAFTGFRAFDVLKPFPLKQLARFPAGWGIMADDLGAAVYTVLLLALVQRLGHWLHP